MRTQYRYDGLMRTAGSEAWVDKLGVWTSALCVVHCLFTPVLLSFSVVVAHMLPSEEWTHRLLAGLVSLFGVFALFRGYRVHRRRRILACMAVGLGLIYAAAWQGDQLPSHASEVAVTSLGSIFMICAHRMNHTFCRDCRCAQ